MRSNIIWNRWKVKSTLRARSISQSKPKPGNGNVNTVYFVIQARGNTRISRTAFVRVVNNEGARNSPVSYSRSHWGELRKTHQSEANAGKK